MYFSFWNCSDFNAKTIGVFHFSWIKPNIICHYEDPMGCKFSSKIQLIINIIFQLFREKQKKKSDRTARGHTNLCKQRFVTIQWIKTLFFWLLALLISRQPQMTIFNRSENLPPPALPTGPTMTINSVSCFRSHSFVFLMLFSGNYNFVLEIWRVQVFG